MSDPSALNANSEQTFLGSPREPMEPGSFEPSDGQITSSLSDSSATRWTSSMTMDIPMSYRAGEPAEEAFFLTDSKATSQGSQYEMSNMTLNNRLSITLEQPNSELCNSSLLAGNQSCASNSDSDIPQFSSDDDAKTQRQYRWPFLVLAILVIVGVLGNVLVCMAICLERRLQNGTNYFLLSLAIADLLVSLLVMPISIVNEVYGK